MSRSTSFVSLTALYAAFAILVSRGAWAQQAKGVLSDLDALAFSRPELRVVETNRDSDSVRTLIPDAAKIDEFLATYGSAWTVWVDLRRGRPSLIDGGAIPFLPGAANSLDWRAFAPEGCREYSCLPKARVEAEARAFLERWRSLIRVDPAELVLDPAGSGPVGSSFYFLRFQWAPGGVPVEGGSVFLRVNGGNLLQVATTNLGDLRLDPKPAFDPDVAWQLLAGHLGEPLRPEDQILERGRLVLVPVTPVGVDPERFIGAYGSMAEYRLCYRILFRRPRVIGTWEALVDARTGELLRFGDANDYGSVRGTIYANDDQSGVLALPLPYVRTGLPAPDEYSDAAGRFDGTAATLDLATGKYIWVTDACGPTTLVTTSGDANFGESVGTNCGVPSPNPGAGGNTWSSKTLYYHLTQINRKVAAFLPDLPWLADGHATASVNGPGWCNASAGTEGVSFYQSEAGCPNLGELPGTIFHEWGHTMERNDGSGERARPVEADADWTAALQMRSSCPGAGGGLGTLCSGYGDPCTQCDGIRDLDYTKHASATPWTAQNHGTVWDCGAGGYNGPCGWEDHCESGISTQALWDFVDRDLPADSGISGANAWQLAERLYFSSLPTLQYHYTCTVGSPTVTDGCGGASLHTVMRVLDDSGDGTANGTPHGRAIYHALARHNIACGTEGEAKNQNQSTCPTLSAPTLSATTGNGRAFLSWTSGGANATRYFVLKNDAGANRGYNRIAEVMAPVRTYTDTSATMGVTSHYQIQPATAHDSCVGPVSNVASVTPASCGGVPVLDRPLYTCNQSVTVTVEDSTPLSTVYVYAWSTSDPSPKMILLAETPPGSDVYVGTFETSSTAGAGKVRVGHGDTLTVRYTDPDFCGVVSQFSDSHSEIDCQGPAISGVMRGSVTGKSAIVSWSTSESADAHVQLTPPPTSFGNPAFSTNHSVVLTGLAPCTTYSFAVASTDVMGNTTVDNNGGALYPFTTTPDLTPVLTRTPSQAIPDNDPAGAWSTLAVYDGRTIEDLDVGVTIQHSRVGDLQLSLRSPDGVEIPLALNVGGAGDDFTGTVFDDESGTPIAAGTAPFTGRYRPASALSVFDGKITTGSWRLTVIDTVAGVTGTVVEWSLRPKYASYSCGLELTLRELLPLDSCSGSGGGTNDGIVDPGEDVTLKPWLLNNGSVWAEQVWGSLTSTSPWVTVTHGLATFPDLAPGAQAISLPEHFGFRVSPAAPCGEVLAVNLHVECWQDPAGWEVPLTFTVGQIVPGSTETAFEELFSGAEWPGTTGWTLERLAGDGVFWRQQYTMACDAEYGLERTFSRVPTDTWANSPGISLSAGVPYTLSFTEWVEGAISYGLNLSVWLGSAPNHAAMTTLLWNEAELADSGCNVRSVPFTVPVSGTYFLGFHNDSPGETGYTRLDIDAIRVTYAVPQSCLSNSCVPCTDPGAPTIFQVSDPNPCSHGGVRISFGAGSGASRHDLYMDGALVLSDISSPVVHHSGDLLPHNYVVRAVWGDCHTDSAPVIGTDESSPTPAAPAPTATDWDGCASDGVRIVWGPVPDATSYDLQVDGTTLVAGVTSPHVYLPGNSTSHSFRVRGKSGNCAGAWSEASSAADENFKPGTVAAPAVADLNPCALTGVQISWGSVAGATSYDIQVDGTTILAGVTSPYTRLPGNANSHSYEVRAWRSSCKGDWSASTAGSDAINLATPAPPTVIDVDACAQSGVSVSWTAVPGATAYDLVVDGSELMANVTSPYLFDPKNAASHDYAIQARATGCTGDRSNPTTRTDESKTPAVPTTLRSNDLAACAANGIRVTWDTVVGATGYELLVDGSTTIAVTGSPYTHLPGDAATHTYRVRAKTDSCASAWSDQDSASDGNLGVPTPAAPTVTDINGCGSTGIRIEWTPLANATAYDVRVDGGLVTSGVTSPWTHVPGNSSSHSYEIRGRNGSCTGAWSPTAAKSDLNDTPGAPVITSVVDIDPAQPTGVRVEFTAGAGATRHDLFRDGSLVQAGYTSGSPHVPGDSAVHSYLVKAWANWCTADSNSMSASDEPLMPPPEVAPGHTLATAQTWLDDTTLAWPSHPSCTSGYLLYRGTYSDLPLLLDGSEDSCLRFHGSVVTDNVVSEMTEDPSKASGGLFWYLVTGLNGAGEGTAGDTSLGPRLVDLWGDCPTP
jgi:subtilisin-like proprotein convertase family protein